MNKITRASCLGLLLIAEFFGALNLALAENGERWSQGGNGHWRFNQSCSSSNWRNSGGVNYFGQDWGRGGYRNHIGARSEAYQKPRYERIDRMIGYGVRSGELSRAEVREIKDRKDELRQDHNRYLRDGYMSHRERQALRQDYRELESDIWHDLNDSRQSRGRYRYNY